MRATMARLTRTKACKSAKGRRRVTSATAARMPSLRAEFASNPVVPSVSFPAPTCAGLSGFCLVADDPAATGLLSPVSLAPATASLDLGVMLHFVGNLASEFAQEFRVPLAALVCLPVGRNVARECSGLAIG